MRIFNRSSCSPEKDRPRQLASVLGDSPGLSKPHGLTRHLLSAFIFLLTCSLLLSTLTISQAIEARFCVKWYPEYGGSPACADDGATVGGKMWVKMVVTWLGTEDIGGVLDGWIEIEENAGHPGQYIKWYPQQQTPACVPCTPPKPINKVCILSQLQPEGDWYLYIPHNGPWTIRGGYKTWPPPEGIPGPPPTPITITLRNLTVQNVTPEYLFWDPDNPPKITYSLDSVQQTPVDVTIKIFPLSTVETPDPIKIVGESRASPGGPYEYTWDGSTTQGPSAPKGIYPFEIEVAQPQPAYPQDQKTSAFLTISGVSANPSSFSPCLNETTTISYTLSEAALNNIVTIKIYDSDFNLVRTVSNASGNSGSNSWVWNGKDDNGNILEPDKYIFVIEAKDTGEFRCEKAHRNKLALQKGSTVTIPFKIVLTGDPNYLPEKENNTTVTATLKCLKGDHIATRIKDDVKFSLDPSLFEGYCTASDPNVTGYWSTPDFTWNTYDPAKSPDTSPKTYKPVNGKIDLTLYSHDWGGSVKVTAECAAAASIEPAGGLWVPQNTDDDQGGDPHQYLPDAWEDPQEQELNNRLPAGQPQIELVVGTDREPLDPDGAGPAGNHDSSGDSLTAWREYRAYSCNCHTTTRLDAWEKELLTEIDIMGAGPQYNPPSVDDVTAAASRARSLAFPDLYIDFHYKIDETNAPYSTTNSLAQRDAYDNAHKNTNNYGQYVHLIFADRGERNWTGISSQSYGAYVMVTRVQGRAQLFGLPFSDVASSTLSHEVGHCIWLIDLVVANLRGFIMYEAATHQKVQNMQFHPDLDMPRVNIPARWIGG